MPMVNSSGATKKAPSADALTRKPTAAAPRILLVMIFLDAVHCPTYTILKYFVLIQFPSTLLQALCYHTDSENPGEGGNPPSRPVLFLQKIFPEKPYRRQKDDVERNQERQPIPAQHRLLCKQRRRRLRASNEQRREQRQQ